MTKLEALQANIAQVHGIVLSDDSFSKACIDEGITETAQYTAENEQEIDMATVRILNIVLGSENFREGNLGYETRNKDYLQKVIDSYLIKWGLEPKYKPSIRSVNPW
jgi:hypothetical protein